MLHSIPVEQVVLVTLMTIDKAMDKALNRGLETEDFFSSRHQTIYQAIADLYHNAKPYDIVFVKDTLLERGQLHDIGGEEYLMKLMADTVTSLASLESCIAKLKKLRECRNLEKIGEQIKELSHQTMSDNLQEQALDLLMGLNSTGQENIAVSIKDGLREAFAIIESRSSRKDIGISTGLNLLDHLIGEIEPSHLCVLAGSPGSGKSTLAQKIALNACLYRQKPTLFFSLEMKMTDVVNRMLSAVAKINFNNIRTGNITAEDAQRFAHAYSQHFEKAPLKIVDKAGMTITQIRAECRKMVAEYGSIGCIVIDYLQLMTDPRQRTRFDEISQISRDLKTLAKDFNTPVIALSQMNRQGQKTKPTMGALRESGQIEQDADQIIFVWRECLSNPNVEDNGTAEMIVAKNRHGRTGSCRVATAFEYCMFSNLVVGESVDDDLDM